MRSEPRFVENIAKFALGDQEQSVQQISKILSAYGCNPYRVNTFNQ